MLVLHKPLVLIGMMGAGKSYIGRVLAARLHVPFIDSDTEIENRAGKKIAEIFAQDGEPAFRKMEKEIVLGLLDGAPKIIALGGGAVIDPETATAVFSQALSVWLKADVDVLLARASKNKDRPLLASGNPAQVLCDLLDKRTPIYARADIHIETQQGEIDSILDNIIKQLAIHPSNQGRGTEVQSNIKKAMDVHIGLDEGRCYAIHIGSGLLENVAAFLPEGIAAKRAFIVCDSNTHLYAEKIAASLTSAKIYTVPAGEKSKSWQQLEALCGWMLESRIARDSCVYAVGGGVIGDLAGFAASVVMRGVPFVQVPTSLLAQVDSSVGGKTGINTAQGKNLVGAFYQPVAVLADTETLHTLPRREILAGYAEIVKYGLIDNPGFFDWLESNGGKVCALDDAFLTHAIGVSCRAKAAIVEADEKESGARALLNLGHTFGHALEAACNYDGRLLHGEAVAIGMVMAFETSVRMGICPPADLDRIKAHFGHLGMSIHAGQIEGLHEDSSPDQLLDFMGRDKKMSQGRLTFVLAKGIGQSFLTKDVPQDVVTRVLADSLALTD